MQKTMILTLAILMATSVTFGQGLMRRPRPMSAEERAKQEKQRKAEREAALPKMQAALKEIAGVTLGQPMSNALPEKNRGEWTNLQKPYRYFTKINPVNDTIEKEKIAKENARREAERKTEANARNAEREKQRKRRLAIEEELRRDRSQREVKKMVETGDVTSAIELCNRYKIREEFFGINRF